MFESDMPRFARSPEQTILSLQEMIAERALLKMKGIRCALAIGCFDLFHAGHLDFLRFARSQGDVLIAGVVSDETIRNTKGRGRPIVPEHERILLVASLTFVDYVVIQHDKYPASLVRILTPDTFVKGYDWRDCPRGREIIDTYAGTTANAPRVRNTSTTKLVEEIRKSEAPSRLLAQLRRDSDYALVHQRVFENILL